MQRNGEIGLDLGLPAVTEFNTRRPGRECYHSKKADVWCVGLGFCVV